MQNHLALMEASERLGSFSGPDTGVCAAAAEGCLIWLMLASWRLALTCVACPIDAAMWV